MSTGGGGADDVDVTGVEGTLLGVAEEVPVDDVVGDEVVPEGGVVWAAAALDEVVGDADAVGDAEDEVDVEGWGAVGVAVAEDEDCGATDVVAPLVAP